MGGYDDQIYSVFGRVGTKGLRNPSVNYLSFKVCPIIFKDAEKLLEVIFRFGNHAGVDAVDFFRL